MKDKVYLGTLKGSHPEAVYLEGFKWDCGWYWAGGYIGNRNFHCHFNGCFLEVPDIRSHPLGNFITPWTIQPEYLKGTGTVLKNGAAVWEDLGFFLNNPQFTPEQWWRIKDLFKQFYTLKEAAEVFAHGGHCDSRGRNPAEIVPAMAKEINQHIYSVIIPEICKITGLTVPDWNIK